ncbi:MAG: discoidin domain-containing protein [Verrucomicrobiota bacterium]
MPNICAGTGSNGVYTIGYSDNGGDTEGWFQKLNNDKSWYNPHFITANLLQLSPLTPPYGPNLALNKTVVVSSLESVSHPGPLAVDGNQSTRWASAAADPQWIYVDLGSTQNIAQVRLAWESAFGSAYHIDVSNDASTWTTVYNRSNGAGGQADSSALPQSPRATCGCMAPSAARGGVTRSTNSKFTDCRRRLALQSCNRPSSVSIKELRQTLSPPNYFGSNPRSFQWQKASDGITYTNVSGATTNTLTLPTVTAPDAGHYRLIFTAAGQSVTSAAVHLTINPPVNWACNKREADRLLELAAGNSPAIHECDGAVDDQRRHFAIHQPTNEVPAVLIVCWLNRNESAGLSSQTDTALHALFWSTLSAAANNLAVQTKVSQGSTLPFNLNSKLCKS